jgi:DNA mismatch repair protein MutL
MIQLLPTDLINKIAAGEVVDRPASVLKELTENAADAGAKKIDILLQKGGIDSIRVTDDGKGMNESDAKLCLLRHATSKLSSVEDLFNIQTLGFRGEALASIAAVSQFELVTKRKDEKSGFRVILSEDLEPQIEVCAANAGTSVQVKNLFYSVPARQKFLKTAQTELTHILRYLQNFALIHPDIELKVEHNGKVLFHYLCQTWEERVVAVLGKEFFGKLIPVEINSEELSISGFIAKPELVHATHKNQYLFVNQRPVYDHMVNRSVLEAYDTLVPRGYFPAFVMRLDISPELVDVNVHPRKSEVKFKNLSGIITSLKRVVHQALQEADLTQDRNLHESSFSNAASFSNGFTSSIPTNNLSTSYSASKPTINQVKQALNFSSSFSGNIREIKASPLEELSWRIIGQIHLSFILVETPEGLQLLDQHAMSEITNYQRLCKERENGEICSQQLLLPELIQVTPEEIVILEENMQLLESLGWNLDQMDHQVVQVGALPEILKIENIKENLHDLITQLKESKDLDMSSRELQLLKYEACRGAIMFGDALSVIEMEALINQWLKIPNNAACEHGRPASARISVDEMRRYFKR